MDSYPGLPADQQAILDTCFHPTGTFIEFNRVDIERSVPDRFEHIVQRQPKRLAIKDQRQSLTYDELNRLSNRIAHAILARGGQGEQPVALMVEHGALAVAAALGTLKAGNVYVPLDPAYSHDRNTGVLEASQAQLILTTDTNFTPANEGAAQTACQVINLDDMPGSVPEQNPGVIIHPNQLAYIIFTSGSTGQPKGVVHTHRNLLHAVMEYTNDIHICAEDRISLASSLSVSASVRNIFGALLNGAFLLPFNLKQEGVVQMATWLLEEEITLHHVNPPTVFRQMANTIVTAGKTPKTPSTYGRHPLTPRRRARKTDGAAGQ